MRSFSISIRLLASLAVALTLSVGEAAYAQTDWAVVKTFQIGGQGGWDYLTVDPQTHRLYVPRSTHTMVIDAESGKTVADIPGQKNAHGVAIAPAAGRGFISDGGGDGAIVIFDLKTYAVLGSIVAQPDADGIIFDPTSGRVLVVSGRGKVLMSLKPDIDPKNGKIDPPIELGGEPEFLAADGAGKVYINLMNTNEVGGRRFQGEEGNRTLARGPGRSAGWDVDRHQQTAPLHRVSRATEVDRDEHRRR